MRYRHTPLSSTAGARLTVREYNNSHLAIRRVSLGYFLHANMGHRVALVPIAPRSIPEHVLRGGI